jgi:hypothetical protein
LHASSQVRDFLPSTTMVGMSEQSSVSTVPGVHSPSPWHAPHAFQVHDALQVRE